MPGPPLGFPASIRFPSASPGSFTTSAGGGTPRHTGSVRVRIDGDSSNVFSVSSLELLELTRDPDAPHGAPLVWETVATQDGAGPIALESAQALVVFVGFACPAHPAQMSFSGSATVFADDTGATVMSVPLSATVSQGSVSLTAITVPQMTAGSAAMFVFQLGSSLLQEVGGVLTCDVRPGPSPFSSDTQPQFPILEPGATLTVPLEVTCAAGTAVGNYQVQFVYKTIDNSKTFAELTVTVHVAGSRSVQVFPSLSPQITLQPSSTTRCALRAVVSDGATTFSIQTTSVPNGLTVTNGQQSVAVNGEVFLGLDIDVSPTAQPGRGNVPLVIQWSVPADDFHAAVAGSLSFDITIELVSITFQPQDDPLVSGQVQATSVRASFASNGDWVLTGSVHDFSTFSGDNFALGFAFNFTDGNAHGPAATGVLGSSATSPPETQAIGVHGNDPWLVQNWPKAFPSGGIFRLHTSTDPGPLLDGLGGAFLSALGKAWDMFDGGSDCPKNPETNEPECPDPGSEQSGGEGG